MKRILVLAEVIAVHAMAGTVLYNPQTEQLILTARADSGTVPVFPPIADAASFQGTFSILVSGLDQINLPGPPGYPAPLSMSIPVLQMGGHMGPDAGGSACLDHTICDTPGGTYLVHFARTTADFQPFSWTFGLEVDALAMPHLYVCGPPGAPFCYYATSWTTTEIVDFGNLRLSDGLGHDVTSRVNVTVTPPSSLLIPEPSGLLLSGFGLVALGLRLIQNRLERSPDQE